MARRLRWTTRAVADLDGILEYIAADAPAYARMVNQRFAARATSLGWRVIYRTSDEAVTIVAIVHGARLLKNTPPL